MKNSITAILVSVTLAFAAFAAGYFLGQHSAGPDTHISGSHSPTVPHSSSTTPNKATQPAQATQPTQSADPSGDPSTAPTVPSSSPATESTEPADVFPININTATLEQLQLIPGIGPVLAQRIIDYRIEIGGYVSVEELLEVKGIGEKTLEKILEYITVEEVRK